MKQTIAKAALSLLAVAVVVVAANYWFRYTPTALARVIVRGELNDPSSAEFRRESVSAKRTTTGQIVVCGEVNARNRMGGMIGFTKYVAEIWDVPWWHLASRGLIEWPTPVLGSVRINGDNLPGGIEFWLDLYCK